MVLCLQPGHYESGETEDDGLNVKDAGKHGGFREEDGAADRAEHWRERQHFQAELVFDGVHEDIDDHASGPDVGDLALDERDWPAAAAEDPEDRGPGAEADRPKGDVRQSRRDVR